MSRRAGAAPAAAALVVLVLLAAGGVVGWAATHSGSGGCSAPPQIMVATAPEIAPAVQAVAAQLRDGGGAGACARFTVTGVDPADIAALLARSVGGTLAGLGQPGGTVKAPDIWIPDSSIWLQRLQASSPGVVPASAPSVAQSPLVLAMPEPVAKQLGWPGTPLSWAGVLTKLLHGNGLRPGIVDPARDVTGLSGLLALRANAAAAGGNQQQTVLGGMRTLALGRSTVRAELLTQFPRASDPRTLAQALSVAPLPEQSVISYDADQPPVPLVALPFGAAATDYPAALDYPYVVLPGVRAGIAGPAQALQSALSGAGYQHRLALLGLRGPDGNAGDGFVTPPGTPSQSPTRPAPVDAATIDQTLALWGQATQG